MKKIFLILLALTGVFSLAAGTLAFAREGPVMSANDLMITTSESTAADNQEATAMLATRKATGQTMQSANTGNIKARPAIAQTMNISEKTATTTANLTTTAQKIAKASGTMFMSKQADQGTLTGAESIGFAAVQIAYVNISYQTLAGRTFNYAETVNIVLRL